MTREELEALIDRGNIEECVEAFEDMPEADRLKLGSAAVSRLRALGKGIPTRAAFVMDADLDPKIASMLAMDVPAPARYRTARAAVLATASFSQWKSVRGHGLPSNEMTSRILRNRSPSWLGEMIELVCEADDQITPRWDLIRGLVREGLCDPPRSGRYIDRMLHTLPGEARRTGVALKAILLEDSGLLDHEIWRIFDTEPVPRSVQVISAATQTGRPETTWEVALVELAKEGRISRERLLDASRDGLSRDLHETRGRFFALIHDRLKPTLEELSVRSARYLDLLGSRNPSTIAFALKVLKELMQVGKLDRAALIDRFSPAMYVRAKGTVKQALSLLDAAARTTDNAALKSRAVGAAVEGLIHEAADIQEAILDFLERHGDRHDPTLRELMSARAQGIAASLRGRLEAWLGANEATNEKIVDDDLAARMRRAATLDPRLAALAGVPEALVFVRGQRAELPELTFDGTEIPRLDPARRLVPIDDLDTLVAMCSRMIENPEPAEDIDRCVDAISRLCDQRPADFHRRTAPLAARLRQLLESPGTPLYGTHFFGAFVLNWLTARSPELVPSILHRSMALEAFTAAWHRALALRVARGQAAPLLAAPTHAGGWIDPRVLVDRFRQRCKLPVADEPGDLILAMLRLAPDRRADALADARDLYGEQGSAIRYALGSSDETIGPTAALWVAAARARSPWADDPAVEARHPGLGPDAGRAATYKVDPKLSFKRLSSLVQITIQREPELPDEVKRLRELPTVAFHAVQYISCFLWPSPASLWPVARESFFAAGVRQAVEAGDTTSNWTGVHGFLQPILDPDVPLRPMARLVLALGLNAKIPGVAGLATDVLIAAIDDGRLGAETLGESLRIVWQFRVETWEYRPVHESPPDTSPSAAIVKPNRLAKTLSDAARTSPLHARIIALAAEQFLMDEATRCRTTTSLIPLWELVKEASVQSGRAVSAAFRTYLEKIESGGRTGRIVKDLLALRDLPDFPALRQARSQALARRIARAERWQAWEGSPS